MVPRKSPDDRRSYGYYLSLNRVTTPERYSIPRITNLTVSLARGFLVTSIMVHNYIPVYQTDILKTIVANSFGLSEFSRMSFGLSKAEQTFHRYSLQGLDSALRQSQSSRTIKPTGHPLFPINAARRYGKPTKVRSRCRRKFYRFLEIQVHPQGS